MEAYSYLARVRHLVSGGVIIGALLGFFSPFLFTALLILGFLIFLFFVDPSTLHDSNMASYIIGAGILCVTFVIPTTIIGTIGGALIASVLAIWEKKLPNVLASCIGFTLGLIMMLIVNYFIWLNNYFGAIQTASFLEFVFPVNKDFVYLAIYENPFFIPSIIAILLSAFGAWQINKNVLLNSNAG